MSDPRGDDPAEQPSDTPAWVKRILGTLKAMLADDSRISGRVLSTAIAFRLFMLIIPTLLILFAGLGFLHASGASEDVDEHLGFSQLLVNTFDRIGADAASNRWMIMGVGIIAMVLAVRAIASTLEIVHARAWDGLIARRASHAHDYAAAFVVGVVIIGYLISAQWLRVHVPGGGAVALIIVGSTAVFGYLWILTLLPAVPGVGWRDLLPGAVLVGVGIQVLHYVTVYHFADKVQGTSETYGRLGIALATLAWLYLTGRMMVFAEILNATLWRDSQRRESQRGESQRGESQRGESQRGDSQRGDSAPDVGDGSGAGDDPDRVV